MERKKAIEVIKKNWPDSSFTMLHEALETLIPELKESEDERTLREIKKYIKEQGDKPTGLPNGTVSVSDMIAWLEKQQDNTNIEQVFRPLAGCCIDTAAKQAIEQQKTGKSVVLAFNGCYIPVENNTVDAIVNKYNAWLEKQSEQNPTDKTEPKFKVGDIITNKKSKDTVKIVQILHDSYCYSGWDGAATVHSDFNISEQDNWELVEQKPTWSEEDEKILNDIIGIIRPFGECPDYPTGEDRVYYYGRQKKIDWLKSLKTRINPNKC